MEDILVKSGLFSLGGKKKVVQLDSEQEVLVVDVAEHEVDRPRKNRGDITMVGKNAIG